MLVHNHSQLGIITQTRLWLKSLHLQQVLIIYMYYLYQELMIITKDDAALQRSFKAVGMWLLGNTVSCPDPTLMRKVWYHMKHFLGLVDLAYQNSVAPIRFTPCGLHVIIMWHRTSHLLLHVRAAHVVPCLNDALSWRSHDMLHPVRPKKRSMCTRPFPPFGGGVWGQDYSV